MAGFTPKFLEQEKAPHASVAGERPSVAFLPMPPPPAGLGMPLTQTRFAVLDTESTGANPESDKIIEVAARVWFLNRQHKAPFVFESYVNPGCKIPPSSMAVHHITNDKVVNAPLLNDAIQSMSTIVDGAIPVAYNSEFDRKILHGTPLHNKYWVDVYRLAMKTWSIGQVNADGFALKSFKQQELRYWLGVRPAPGEAHRAAADIYVTGLVFQAAVDIFLSSGMPDDARVFMDWLEAPIMHKTIPFGGCAGRTPEDLDDYELRRHFDPSKDMHEALERFNVLDYLRPEMMRRALSEKTPPRQKGMGVKR
jgi:DNA polymerase III epsilon subunit-like protein